MTELVHATTFLKSAVIEMFGKIARKRKRVRIAVNELLRSVQHDYMIVIWLNFDSNRATEYFSKAVCVSRSTATTGSGRRFSRDETFFFEACKG